uniref:Major sperm protein n=1 Tax=Parascaris univalens TaxID=6257 RepID=A0A915C5H9_PARUN
LVRLSMAKKSSSHSTSSLRRAGGSPDYELALTPPWIIFSAEDSYTRPQYSYITIQNIESVAVVYRIRTKDRSFPRFSRCHGYLPAGGSDEVTIVIPTSEHWPRDPAEFAGKHHKVLIENLTVPPHTTPPTNPDSASALSRRIFKSTPPLTRMYCKLNFILPKLVEASLVENETSATV